MKLLCVLFALFCGSAVIAAQAPTMANQAQPVTNQAQSATNNDQTEAVKGNNAFAVNLYGQLSAQPGNLFFSPESISTAFAMAYAGARGQTATEMAQVFHFTLPPDRLHPAMGALLAGMNAPHQGYALSVADALWAQKGESFLPAYLKLVESNYGAGFHAVDFRSAPESVRATINAWIEKQTDDKIQNLLGPGTVSPSTRLILTNAIYFKGTWIASFDKTQTKDEVFHLSAAKTVKSPMMHRTGSYRYYGGGAFQALELPYTGNQLSMVVLLPEEITGLPALEKSLTSGAVNQWLSELAPVNKVILTFPRFKMTQQFELNGALDKMGMAQAFSNAADFSGMDGKPDFAISAAIHKAYIDVNEEGTEAAAATGIVFRATAMRAPAPEPPPIVFTADHPFLFLIRDTATGSILFLGRVTDPTK
jgi:serpin B